MSYGKLKNFRHLLKSNTRGVFCLFTVIEILFYRGMVHTVYISCVLNEAVQKCALNKKNLMHI